MTKSVQILVMIISPTLSALSPPLQSIPYSAAAVINRYGNLLWVFDRSHMVEEVERRRGEKPV